MCQALFPHAKSAAAQRPEEIDTPRDWASILYRATWYAWKIGNGIEAENMSIQAMKARRKVLGKDDEDTLWSMVMVDALDECDDDNNIQTIFNHFAMVRQLKRVRIQVFLTSRPEVPIRHGFHELSSAEHQDFVLHNISPSIVDHDIRVFLEHAFKGIARDRSLGASWPGQEIVKLLVQHASGLSIWAATACRFIREGRAFAEDRLATILQYSRGTANEPEKHLNEMYLTVLRYYISKYSDEEAENFNLCLRVC